MRETPEDAKASGAEERERLKELYKREYRARKAYLEELKRKRPMARIAQALEDLTTSFVTDDTAAWTAELNRKTAVNEAKVDMALENAAPEAPATSTETPTQSASAGATALERLKIELGLTEVPKASEATQTHPQKKTLGPAVVPSEPSSASPEDPPNPDALPEDFSDSNTQPQTDA